MAYFEKALRESAHSVSIVTDIDGANWLLHTEDFDAVILFERAGESETKVAEDTRAVRETVRSRSPETWRQPLIFVLCDSATSSLRTTVLRAGADACFCEPIYFAEVQARLGAFRRCVPSAAQEEALGEPEKRAATDRVGRGGQTLDADASGAEVGYLDAGRRELIFAGVHLSLSAREYLFVDCLLHQAPHPVSHEQLLQYCWSENDDVLQSVVGQTALRLRKRMQHAGMAVKIESVPRFGYRLIFGA
ncbi:winged helix-turn-helix domain-containing protein [Robbsia sp. KACC 23696]|uniref:winged helix-turn-helix domain-containing protein n=1 Tax=Robbsia sp. KACC 23696 TaxID=3149231 RepID=UPI00325B38E0